MLNCLELNQQLFKSSQTNKPLIRKIKLFTSKSEQFYEVTAIFQSQSNGEKYMTISNNFYLKSPEKIEKFLKKNKKTTEILNAIEPQLFKYFPDSKYSLEVCNELGWTTETKLLLNIQVSDRMFFNGLVDHMNSIYEEIEPLIEDILCPVVLFPEIENKNFDSIKMKNNSTVNLIARTTYFNNDRNGIIQREMTLREISKEQQVKEIISYCKEHEHPKLSDLLFDLQLDLFDVDTIIDELEEKGIDLNVEY